MLAPRYPAAVVAGNVETSQAITDTLYGALGVLAASQGTMNNFTFGNDTLPVLRDDLRRRGRGARFRRRERRADAHDQFAADRSGGARVALPGAARVVRDPARQRRRGPPSRRRRRRAARALPRADDGGDARQPSARRAVRRGRRRAGRASAATGSSAADGAREEFGATCAVDDERRRRVRRSRRRAAAGSGRRSSGRDAARAPRAGAGIIAAIRAHGGPPWPASTISRQGHPRQERQARRLQGQGAADRQHGEQVRVHAAVQGPRGALPEAARQGPRDPRLPVQPVRRAGAGQRGGDRDRSARSTTA